MRRLVTTLGWKEEDILILLDRSDCKNQPTQKGTSWPLAHIVLYLLRAGMLAALKWLVEGSAAGDHLIWHYSGHGGQSRCVSVKISRFFANCGPIQRCS